MAFRRTSPADFNYNCIGYVLCDRRNLWPKGYGNFWPRSFPAAETVHEFTAAFALYQYEPCDSFEPERGYEKIALFTIDGAPTHAARSLASGKWTSKLSDNIDIEHDTLNTFQDFPPELHCHVAYGRAIHFYRRSLHWRRHLIRRLVTAVVRRRPKIISAASWITYNIRGTKAKATFFQ